MIKKVNFDKRFLFVNRPKEKNKKKTLYKAIKLQQIDKEDKKICINVKKYSLPYKEMI